MPRAEQKTPAGPASAEPARRFAPPTLLAPRAFEVLALVAFVASITALQLFGVRVTFATVVFTLRETGPRLLAALAAGVGLNLLFRAFPPGRLRAYLPVLKDPAWLLETFRIWLACVLLTHSYLWLKVSIPLLNPRLWDDELARFDAWLHGGISPSRFVVALLEDTVLMPFIDWSYAWWLAVVLAMFGLLATSPSPRVRAQFLFSHVAIWTLGVWLYIAMPALGPGLAFPGEWRTVHAALPRALSSQGALLRNHARVVESRETGVLKAGFNPSLGVAAMPSLHVGIDWLILLWCFRRARPFAAPFLAFVVVTFLGSIATGWHYAVDGYVGIALGQACYWISQRVSLELPDPAEAETTRSSSAV